MCTGRVDLAFLLRSFIDGADGVFIGGCWPGECHYLTQGNFDALSNVHLCKKLMTHIGLNPDRLRIEWISASEGSRFAEVMDDFSKHLRELGNLGTAAGENGLLRKLEAVNKLIPYIKLVERERLRVPVRTEEAICEFYRSDDFDRLFNELIADKLAISQMVTLLREKPLSAGEIAESLGLDPSEVSRHLDVSARQGLVKFDNEQNLIVAA